MTERRRDRRGATAARAEQLYERYKDALRRGHVAALRGDVDDALAAYEEAAGIAPRRPLPRTSAGIALVRAGRPEEALRQFALALRAVPDDEATLAARAEALAGLGRRREAADDLDRVAEARERAGRTSEALDAAARALELAEARHRRRTVERLVAALGGSEQDDAARAALASAMAVLDAGPTTGERGTEVAGAAAAAAGHGALAHTGAAPGDARTDDEARAGDAAGADDAARKADVDREADDESGGGGPGAIASPPQDAAALAAAASAAVDAGDAPTARDRLLELSAIHRGAGRIDAALDACYLALSVAPDDVGVHLALAGLYGDRGWTAAAAEKLDLLARLTELDGDHAAAERIIAARDAGG